MFAPALPRDTAGGPPETHNATPAMDGPTFQNSHHTEANASFHVFGMGNAPKNRQQKFYGGFLNEKNDASQCAPHEGHQRRSGQEYRRRRSRKDRRTGY